jgi:CHAD domain-containing protein
LTEPPFAAPAAKSARRHLPSVIAHARRRVDAHLAAGRRLPPGDAHDTAMHEARKAAKQLRYAAEAAAPVLGRPARTVVKHAKQLQEMLGDHQDATMRLAVLFELGAAAPLDGGNGFTFGLLYQQTSTSPPDSTTQAAAKALRTATRQLVR